MTDQITSFLLVPDSGAARRVRRLLAEGGARSGIIVGTWLELIHYAADAYVLPAQRDDWENRLHAALQSLPGAFWAESLEVAPGETAAEVESALIGIVSARDFDKDLDDVDTARLPPRARKHVDDILRLARALDGALPDELAVIRDLLAMDPADAIRRVHVSRDDTAPALTRWQAALVDKLNRDAGLPGDAALVDALKQTLGHGSGADPAKGAPDSLVTLQTGLFLPPGPEAHLDETIQWIGVRDYLAEVETAAGMVQTMLDDDPALRPADIGLLLPDDFIYSVAVDDVFTRAGLAVSGLPLEHWQRDLGREALFHFLYCRQKPAPAMALAVCLASPLMPWSREDGAVLAQRIMEKDYALRPLRSADHNARAMLDMIREGDEDPDALARALRAFVDLLDGGEAFAEHVHQAKATADELCRFLANMPAIDWPALRRAATPITIASDDAPDFNLEGVTVWRESHEPWRPIRHLIVFGFATGHYPRAPGQSPVFSVDDLNAIHEHLGLALDTPADELARRRARFKRQLAAASDTVSFLVPRRDPAGAAQAPADSLVFMHRLFHTPHAEAPEDMVLELDSPEDREHIRFLARAEPGEPQPPRVIVARDIKFDRDLLAMRADAEGNPKPESPSSLETLMVSRLAWLLRRLDAEPLGWAPETLDPMLMGTLAHQVFEDLFPGGGALPDAGAIEKQVGPRLDDAISRYAPFLRAAQWQVERRHLVGEITRAAVAWGTMLGRLKAEVLGSEVWLAGRLNDIPIHGQADALLGLSGNRLLVVDYKRSSSGSRRPRMQKRYDSQASLYRTMLETGGPKDQEAADLRHRLREAGQTGIVYYMLNDQTALSDSTLVESPGIPGWDPVGGDVASGAMALIGQCLREVRQGLLTLNREADAEFFDRQAGIKPYALDNSPLIPLFTLRDDAGEVE